MKFSQSIKNILINLPGWKTDRKIVVFESDDWGSIRMPSKEVYYQLLGKGIKVDKCHFNKYDSVETESDLCQLFEVLSSVKDKHHKNAKFTANVVVANPDFQKIRESDFLDYIYIRIDNDERLNGKDLIKNYFFGESLKCFHLQSHGREHVNIKRWMHHLRKGYYETRSAFDLGVYGISTTISTEDRKSFLSSFDFENDLDEDFVGQVAVDGLRIFEDIFGYRSESFIAPNYTWSLYLEEILKNYGVRYLQGGGIHRYSYGKGERKKRRLRPTGSTSRSGLINLSRNAFFEPTSDPDYDWINNCMYSIDRAFRWQKPAIVSSHRVNYMGTLDEKNRGRSLGLLQNLLNSIIIKWPDVEFMASDELGELIEKSSRQRII